MTPNETAGHDRGRYQCAGVSVLAVRIHDGRRGIVATRSEWTAPVLWRSEFRNILAGYLRRQIITFDQACRLQAEAESLLDGFEHDVDSRHVLDLVRTSDCSAYDCEFVALAETLNSCLVTMDKKLLRAFPQRAIPLAVV
jgi:predicted nucleic acid-binding protein